MIDSEQIIVKDFENKQIKIVPIFDVHIGAKEFCEADFKAYIDKIAKEENTYVVIGGDIVNNSTKTSVANPFDEIMRPSEQKKYAARLLKPIKDKILCAVSGNHEQRSRKESDDDAMYDILCKLDIEDIYRENIAFLMVRINKTGTRGRDGHNWTYAIVVTHGAGGGMYIGSGANRLERLGATIEGMDLLITGHTHKPLTFPSARIKIDTHNKLLIREQFTAVVATSWLDWGGYSARKMLSPTAMCEQEIILSNTEKKIKVIQG